MIDTAEKRKAISGIPFGLIGVTNSANHDREWRRETIWNYPFILALRIMKINDVEVSLIHL
jgi:hypothetical protein